MNEELEPNGEDLSLDQLAEQLWPKDPPAEEPKEPEPEVEVPPEPEAPKEPPASGEQEPPDDLAALERLQRELADRRVSEELAAVRANNSRLAGKIGYLEQRLKESAKARTEPMLGSETEEEPEAVAAIREDLRKLREERDVDLRDQAIAAETAAFGVKFQQQSYAPEEVQASAAKYAAEWQESLAAPTPESARESVRLVLSRIATDVETARLEKRIATARERSASSTSRIAAERQAAASSGSGGVRRAINQDKSPEDMTVEELASAIWGSPARR